jgi:hypothetical protein
MKLQAICKKSNVILIIFILVSIYWVFPSTQKQTLWKPAESPLKTKWTKNVSPDSVLPEYPRPQIVRKEWKTLNGLWNVVITGKSDTMTEIYKEKILVPFPIESALSGIGKKITPNDRIWYGCSFEIPPTWKNKRILLHFGAVDWETTVYLNRNEVGTHRGGYDAFSYDITPYCTNTGTQELVVSVWDPTNNGGQPVGKQTLRPSGIYYTPSSGIWQTVWLEPVPEIYINAITITPNVDKNSVSIIVKSNADSNNTKVEATVLENTKQIGKATGKPGETITISIPKAKLWLPDSPFLYDLNLTLSTTIPSIPSVYDNVKSYFGMRKVEVKSDDKGINRIFVNNRFIFQLGPLDQGFWPDGLYTAPTDDALKYDLDVMKQMGFNMVRKHVKVEPDRWYYWCDKLGILVWQDMPSGRNRTNEEKNQFEIELKEVVTQFYNHPCIIMWVPFNEGWGQYDTEQIVQKIKTLDPTRLVDNASGWTDRKVGDVRDLHSYPDPQIPRPEPARAVVQGEFGGLGFNYPNHTWNPSGWGYDLLKNLDDLVVRYESVYMKLLPLIEKNGLCAGVYTQISDIESENNGIMTYDREIIKIPPEKAKLAHNGYFPPQKEGITDIFVNEATIILTCFKEGAEIRYTLDNTEPTKQSLRYKDGIHLTKNSIIKTRAFWKEGVSSRINTFTITKAEPRPAVDISEKVNGLSVAYYEGDWKILPNFSELTPKTTKTVGKFDLSLSERNDYFALKFEGYISVPVTGVYTFFVNSDDGSRLFIGDKMLLDNDGIHGIVEKSGSIALQAGEHPITLLYFNGTGGRGLRVSYEGPDIEKQEIPEKALFRISS